MSRLTLHLTILQAHYFPHGSCESDYEFMCPTRGVLYIFSRADTFSPHHHHCHQHWALDPKNFDCLQWFLRELRHSSHAFILASILFSSFVIIIFIVIMVKPKANLLIKVRQRICGEIVN